MLAFVIFAAALAATAETPCKLSADAVVITREALDNVPGNEAALITDPADVAELVRLVGCNPHANHHACGYDWRISFRQSDGTARSFGHNDECEVYANNDAATQKLLLRYFDAVRRDPRAFVFDVTLPAAIDPRDAAARLRADDMTPILLRGPDQRLPRIVLDAVATADIPEDRAQWDAATEKTRAAAKARLQAAVDDLAKRYPGIAHDKLADGNGMFGGGKIEEHVRTTVLFPFGTPLRDINVTGAEILERSAPSHVVVQIVAKKNSAKAVKAFAEERLGVAVQVVPYPTAP